MPTVIGLGSNLGDRKLNIEQAQRRLKSKLSFVAQSPIYQSPAVDYEAQPDFYNQVIEFETPNLSPDEILDFLLATEIEMGRNRVDSIPKGPRIIDLDLLFIDSIRYKDSRLEIPHPRAGRRTFVLFPLQSLPCFDFLRREFNLEVISKSGLTLVD